MDDRMKERKSTYWADLKSGTQTLLGGLKVSILHLKKSTKKWAQGSVAADSYFESGEGLVTLQYPREKLPVPDHGRYKLHNEIDDCIVCDKCAKICPVNCIEIEPVRAVEEIGKTSDGTSKRIYAAKFDIDMGKCCFCGLCTTVCPTECLTMTDEYDFSTFDIKDHNVPFAVMSPLEILEKKKVFEEAQQAKQQKQEAAAASPPLTGAKPVFRPKMPANPAPDTSAEKAPDEAAPKKPVFRPKMPVMKPVIKKDTSQKDEKSQTGEAEQAPEKKPAFRPKPVMKPKKKD